jgi:hypothetical protein
LSFVSAGFNRVDATLLERVELAKKQTAVVTAAVARRLAGLFESKAGPALRFLMPLVLLAAVYVPLRRALDEVAWEVRARAAVKHALEHQRHRIVQSRVRVERHEVDLLVVLVGSTADADAARSELGAELEAAAGVVPRVEVLAVPDATAFAGLESTLRTANDPLPVPPAPPPSPAEQLESARALIRAQVGRLWPAATAGEALVLSVGGAERGPLRVEVVHLGSELNADALESLRRSLGAALERDVDVVDVAIPADPLTRAEGDARFLTRVTSALRQSAAIAEISVCIVQPAEPQRRRRGAALNDDFAEVLRAALAAHPRVTTQPGADWRVQFVRGACPAPEPAGERVLSSSGPK